MTLETLVEMVDWTLGELAKLETGGPQMIIDYAEEPNYWTCYQQ